MCAGLSARLAFALVAHMFVLWLNLRLVPIFGASRVDIRCSARRFSFRFCRFACLFVVWHLCSYCCASVQMCFCAWVFGRLRFFVVSLCACTHINVGRRTPHNICRRSGGAEHHCLHSCRTAASSQLLDDASGMMHDACSLHVDHLGPTGQRPSLPTLSSSARILSARRRCCALRSDRCRQRRRDLRRRLARVRIHRGRLLQRSGSLERCAGFDQASFYHGRRRLPARQLGHSSEWASGIHPAPSFLLWVA